MDDTENPTAEHAHVELANDTDCVEIKARGERAVYDGVHSPRVYLDIGELDTSVSLTLTPTEARSLRGELTDAINQAEEPSTETTQ